jgi:alkylation response protein AidB-like acyl-CoA dehydrogenase
MPQHPIVDAARDLKSLITKHRPEGDRQANLTREVVNACGETGLFRLAAPKEVGGLELLARDVVSATQAVSRADPAVGWYVINSMAASFLAAFVGEEERHALFEDPNANFGFAFMPTGKATPVEGGYRLSGFWPVMTGGNDAKWASIGGHVMDGDAPREVDGIPRCAARAAMASRSKICSCPKDSSWRRTIRRGSIGLIFERRCCFTSSPQMPPSFSPSSKTSSRACFPR